MARIRRLNKLLSENARAPYAERWIVAPFVIVSMMCALIAFATAGQLLGGDHLRSHRRLRLLGRVEAVPALDTVSGSPDVSEQRFEARCFETDASSPALWATPLASVRP